MTAIWIKKEKDARDTPGLLAKSIAQNLPPKINEFIMQGNSRSYRTQRMTGEDILWFSRPPLASSGGNSGSERGTI